eukprot:CAMPEP_0197316242 /NCGR_PEP_ID=MMETSP0891-20130614/41808_1 /TAXON_ID=44058 ORGANISM="Aureoumbra lagunensis, Strain CCMP1510" /NCGR_SAMPLE_ID=MMETSP0891 /ASSEMBLY_ACC=CAM_ASM_000534 /LENGTH=386 /DNA_ID=CAMNT_0042805619 /DNA_START=109 /DNA_END=1269 /DNA_ORIENTATION=+
MPIFYSKYRRRISCIFFLIQLIGASKGNERKVQLSRLSPKIAFGIEATIEHGSSSPYETLNDEKIKQCLQQAFTDSLGLVVVRWKPALDRRLNKDEFLALCEAFGQVEYETAVDGSFERLVDNDARIHEFSVAPSSRTTMTTVQFDGEKPSWHTDQSFRKPRPEASLLYCLNTPANGVGQTLFASTVLSANELHPKVLEYLRTTVARHSYSTLRTNLQNLSTSVDASVLTGDTDRFADYPLYNGDALDLAPHVIARVSGLDNEQSKRLVHALVRFATAPKFVYAHVWNVDDTVLWSNHRLMHAATPVTTLPSNRLMWRTTFAKMNHPDQRNIGNCVFPPPTITAEWFDDYNAAWSSLTPPQQFDSNKDSRYRQIEDLVTYLTELGG